MWFAKRLVSSLKPESFGLAQGENKTGITLRPCSLFYMKCFAEKENTKALSVIILYMQVGKKCIVILRLRHKLNAE